MFSVVIPLYNKEHVIVQTLKSVLLQAFTEFEVIIVNDGSTDNGVDIVKNFTNDSRIKIINQDNQGVSVARNVGVENSKYNYIAFLDGDDEWLPSYLEKMNEAIAQFPEAGMFCCGGYIKDANGEHKRIAAKYKNKIQEINYFENPHVFSHTSATIVKKEIFFQTTGFPKGMKCNQDYALFYSMALISKTIYVGELLSVYNGGILGQTTSIPYSKRHLLQEHVINRFKLTYDLWENTVPKNQLFIIFYKYEIRGKILGYLRRNDYNSLNRFVDGINKNSDKYFLPFEFQIYKSRYLKYISMLFIYFSKIIWRSHGFPIIGKN